MESKIRKLAIHKGKVIGQMFQGSILWVKVSLFNDECWHEADYYTMLGDLHLQYGFPDKAQTLYKQAYAYYVNLKMRTGPYLPSCLAKKMVDLELKIAAFINPASIGE